LFNAFEQGGREMTRMFGGLGLGLAIGKALVDAHGGTISVASDGAGRGATFTVDLPAIPAPGAGAPHEPDGSARTGLRRVVNCKILIVEDHADTARAMARILAGRGYTVRTADTVASALSAVSSDAYDLIISDIGLPDGSGLDLMRQVLARGGPVQGIALSGFGMEEDVRRSMAAGFQSHLTKPVNIDRLEAAVQRLTDHCAGQVEVTSS
jgi:two-component system CheB/CheR fusion protein